MKYFILKILILTLLLATVSLADKIRQRSRNGRTQLARQGRDGHIQGDGIDFSSCKPDPDTGLCCIDKLETIQSIVKDPILECTHKNVEKCHYTYVTQFTPAQEEVCEENFEKTCQITYKQMAVEESVEKCYKPIEKVCNGQGPEECRTVYESSCTTKYIEKKPGKFVGDTKCEKLPVEICGAGCVFEEGPEECHDKILTSLIDVPEEVCDLNPQKICKFQTKLVPKLKPTHECTVIPKETCHLKFDTPKPVDKDLKTRWCLDDTPPEPAETYEESPDLPPPITEPPSTPPPAAYGNPPPIPQPTPPPALYGPPAGRQGRVSSVDDPNFRPFVPAPSQRIPTFASAGTQLFRQPNSNSVGTQLFRQSNPNSRPSPSFSNQRQQPNNNFQSFGSQRQNQINRQNVGRRQ